MNEKLMEIREYTGVGYKPLVDFKEWRVAILNYLEGIHPDNNNQMERHNETDEVFVLLKGKGILFIGEGDDKLSAIHPQVMEYNRVYNIKAGVWHTIVMSLDASVLITENRDTAEKNSNYLALDPAQRQFIARISREKYPGLWGG